MQKETLRGDKGKVDRHPPKVLNAMFEFQRFRDELKSTAMSIEQRQILEMEFLAWQKTSNKARVLEPKGG